MASVASAVGGVRGAHREIVLVSGAPGAGKSTQAGPLAAELGFALLAKDLGAASMELLWALAADAPAVVLEANFWPDDDRHQSRIRELAAHAVEVYCACPLPIALERYAARQASRHAAHAEAHRPVSPEAWARWARPVGVGELVTVDTSAPVDIAALAAEVRARLGISCQSGCG